MIERNDVPRFALRRSGDCAFCGRPKFLILDGLQGNKPIFDGAHESAEAADACLFPEAFAKRPAMEVSRQ